MFKEFEYKLKEQDENGDAAPYKGKVKLKVLPFIERNELLKRVNFKLDQSNAELADNLDSTARLAEVVKENVISMEVKKGKKVFKDLEEIDYDKDVGIFYTGLGLVVCQGIDLGNE
jgi:hypothetical protein